jgi:predicted transcriptional regulator
MSLERADTAAVTYGGSFLRGGSFAANWGEKTIDNDEDFRHNAVMESKRRKPTEAELAILRVLWEGKAQTVRAIHKVLNESRPTGYTTVLKLMQIMTEKGLVERDETCRPQLYRARYTQQQTQRQLVGDLMNRAFGGSVKSLVLQALAAKKSSPEELEAMENLLDRIEGGKQ